MGPERPGLLGRQNASRTKPEQQLRNLQLWTVATVSALLPGQERASVIDKVVVEAIVRLRSHPLTSGHLRCGGLGLEECHMGAVTAEDLEAMVGLFLSACLDEACMPLLPARFAGALNSSLCRSRCQHVLKSVCSSSFTLVLACTCHCITLSTLAQQCKSYCEADKASPVTQNSFTCAWCKWVATQLQPHMQGHLAFGREGLGAGGTWRQLCTSPSGLEAICQLCYKLWYNTGRQRTEGEELQLLQVVEERGKVCTLASLLVGWHA